MSDLIWPIFHDVQQNSDAWNALRIGLVTGSNAGTFMANLGKSFGEPARRYALQLALEQETGRRAEFSFTNEHMERGHEQEPVAKLLYSQEQFVDLGNGGFFQWNGYGDSPDALVGDDGVLEVKSVIASVHYATLQRGSFDPAYKWQLVTHLDCTKRDWVDFVSYCADFPEGRQLATYRLYRRDCQESIALLRDRRAEFMGLVAETRANLKEHA